VLAPRLLWPRPQAAEIREIPRILRVGQAASAGGPLLRFAMVAPQDREEWLALDEIEREDVGALVPFIVLLEHAPGGQVVECLCEEEGLPSRWKFVCPSFRHQHRAAGAAPTQAEIFDGGPSIGDVVRVNHDRDPFRSDQALDRLRPFQPSVVKYKFELFHDVKRSNT
jgi:hypothetical protein